MKRSRKSVLVVPSLGALLLVMNCTVKVENDDGHGGATSANGGSTTTNGGASAGGTDTSKGGTTTANGGGATTYGGSTSGGYAGNASSGGWTATGGAGGVGEAGSKSWGGAGGVGGAAGDVCDECLVTNCTKEFEACLDDVRCFNDDPNGTPGQYQDVVQCMDQERTTHALKREDVVNCGLTVADSLTLLWPPENMAQTTTDLINCMATGETNKPNNNSWADDTGKDSDPIKQPWAPTSCAKTSCTSQL